MDTGNMLEIQLWEKKVGIGLKIFKYVGSEGGIFQKDILWRD